MLQLFNMVENAPPTATKIANNTVMLAAAGIIKKGLSRKKPRPIKNINATKIA